MFKNVASQKLTVFAFADAGHATLDPGEPVTGDAANISCKVEQDDDGTQSATNDVAPTEVEDGQYRFDLTQAETNGDKLTFYPQSSTAGVQVVALPSSVIYTRPQYFADLGIASDGDLTKVNTLDGHTAQTADHTAGIADIPTVAEFNARTLVAASYFDPAADTVANVTTVATLTGHTAQTADHTAGIADIPTVAEFNARTLVAASYFDPAADAVANVTLVATTTTNTDMRGTDSANTTVPDAAGTAATLHGVTDGKIDTIDANVDTLLTRITSTLFSGITSLAEWLGLMAGEQTANATALTEVKATGAGSGTYDESTDSLEAIAGAGGGGAPTVVQIRQEMDSNSTQLAAIVADTNELQTDDVPGLIAALNNVAATDIVSSGAITTAGGAVSTVTTVGTTTTNTDMRGTDSAALATALATAQTDLDTITGSDGVLLATDALTEAYAADGVAPSIAQILFELRAMLCESNVASTTITTKKLDGSTTAATYTIDDDTSPTTITRAT